MVRKKNYLGRNWQYALYQPDQIDKAIPRKLLQPIYMFIRERAWRGEGEKIRYYTNRIGKKNVKRVEIGEKLFMQGFLAASVSCGEIAQHLHLKEQTVRWRMQELERLKVIKSYSLAQAGKLVVLGTWKPFLSKSNELKMVETFFTKETLRRTAIKAIRNKIKSYDDVTTMNVRFKQNLENGYLQKLNNVVKQQIFPKITKQSNTIVKITKNSDFSISYSRNKYKKFALPKKFKNSNKSITYNPYYNQLIKQKKVRGLNSFIYSLKRVNNEFTTPMGSCKIGLSRTRIKKEENSEVNELKERIKKLEKTNRELILEIQKVKPCKKSEGKSPSLVPSPVLVEQSDVADVVSAYKIAVNSKVAKYLDITPEGKHSQYYTPFTYLTDYLLKFRGKRQKLLYNMALDYFVQLQDFYSKVLKLKSFRLTHVNSMKGHELYEKYVLDYGGGYFERVQKEEKQLVPTEKWDSFTMIERSMERMEKEGAKNLPKNWREQIQKHRAVT